MSDTLYDLHRVRHFYGDKKVLDIEQLAIPPGSITGLSGPNGSGKSTLLKLLAFAMRPTQGEIRFNGHLEHPLSPRVRSRVTLLTQTPYLLKRSVFDNVAYGLKIRKDKRDLENRVNTALAAVGLNFEEFHRRQWHELSGGEAQRVAMAARLILKPDALLLDEPVASVDTESARLIRRASIAARDHWGCTLIIVSHDLSWLHECSDTRISMARGRIYATGEESVFPPPYLAGTDGFPVKDLGNGEVIRLSPRDGDTAIIQKRKIDIKLTRDNGADNQISAVITQMLLEKKSGNILTTIALDGFTITLSISPDQVASQNLHPGKPIIISFNAADISWR
ncbi:MAG TPA: tungsten ABC transporter ATP-binding protein [Desulfobacteraceae bacterium]|nr:tungsten ABC transporter ATP-binding protein [Desulfobacteraceae bacterium]